MAGRRRALLRLMHPLFILLALLPATQAQAGTVNCFGFNGGNYTGNIPCPGSNACCGSGATCLSNRICVNPSGELVRAPCRVHPFDDTCSQICLFDEPSPGGLLPRIKICDDGSLCCTNDTTCCESKRGVFLDEGGNRINGKATAATTSYPPNPSGTGRLTITPSISSTTTPPPFPSLTGSTSPTSTIPEPTDPPSAENTTARKVGLGVGIPVGVLAIGAVIFLLVRRKRKASPEGTRVSEMDAEGSAVSEMPGAGLGPSLPPKERYGGPPVGGSPASGSGSQKEGWTVQHSRAELGSAEVSELDAGGRQRYELGG